jgi:hypothetical protein
MAGEVVADPLAVAGVCGCFAIEGLRPLDDNPGQAGASAFDVRLGELLGFVGADADLNLDACIAQHGDAFAGHGFEGIEGADHHALDARVDDGFGTGGLLAVVGAGFKCDVDRGVCGVDAFIQAIFEGLGLGVEVAEPCVVATGDDLAVTDDHRADHWVWLDVALALAGQLYGLTHENFILHAPHDIVTGDRNHLLPGLIRGLLMKWIKRIVVLVALVVVLVGVVGYIAIDRLTKAGIERGGTYAMGVDTKLDNIHIGLFSGSVSLDGLSVANPEGFKSDHFMTLGDGSVEVTLGSLMGDKVEVPSLRLNNINLALEKDKGTANYTVILDHLATVTSSGDEPAEDTGDEGGKKFVIKELVITDVKVKADVIGGMSTKITVPEIRLTDIGSDSDNGVLLKDLSGIILTAILSSVVEQAGDLLPGGIGEGLQGGLASVGDLGDFGVQIVGDVKAQASEKLGEATQILGEKSEEAGKAIDKLSEGLGGFLGGKKDKKEAPK